MTAARKHGQLAPVRGLARLLPPLRWLPGYTVRSFVFDFLAAVLTTLVSVPQGIAFALLAGLAPEQGLYAAVLPPLVYACFGTSRTLLVGPVSVTAVMVAGALSAPELQGHGDYLTNALVLGCESGLILTAIAILRLGALINFISHPVLTGFTSGAAILIIVRLLPSFTGQPLPQCTLNAAWLGCMQGYFQAADVSTMAIGVGCIAVMLIWGPALYRLFRWMGFKTAFAAVISRTGALAVVALGGLFVWRVHSTHGLHVPTVGTVPSALPSVSVAFLDADTWLALLPSAFYVGLVGYVSTVAMAKVTANMRREKIDPNQEALALGVSNIYGAFVGSMPVAGGMSQTMLKIAAGAETQVSTVVTSALVAECILYLNPLLALIPKVALSAIVFVAILPLIKIRSVVTTWRYQKSDGIPELATFLGVLFLGLEPGLLLGIGMTLLGYIWQTGHPHIAIVGRVPHTEHFRNICRHHVETWPTMLLVRVDENLTFANIGAVEDFIANAVATRDEVEHVVLICAPVSHIDITALRALENFAITLKKIDVSLHLSEVKGPVMDQLTKTSLLTTIAPGKVYFHTEAAIDDLVGNAPTIPTRQPRVSVG